jgi:pimeloyl-ACP methyl ester carboxylesterase
MSRIYDNNTNDNDGLDWETDDREGFVSIGTHSLYLSVSGPPRRREGETLDPLVIIETGMGDGYIGWNAFRRAIVSSTPSSSSSSAATDITAPRVLAYDRAGLGRSEASPLPRTAENMAAELKALLKQTRLLGPYVVVTHSYGGIITREFVALCQEGNDKVVGTVFVDSEQEETNKVLAPPCKLAMPLFLSR